MIKIFFAASILFLSSVVPSEVFADRKTFKGSATLVRTSYQASDLNIELPSLTEKNIITLIKRGRGRPKRIRVKNPRETVTLNLSTFNKQGFRGERVWVDELSCINEFLIVGARISRKLYNVTVFRDRTCEEDLALDNFTPEFLEENQLEFVTDPDIIFQYYNNRAEKNAYSFFEGEVKLKRKR